MTDHLLFLSDGTLYGIASKPEIDAMISEGILSSAKQTEQGFIVQPNI